MAPQSPIARASNPLPDCCVIRRLLIGLVAELHKMRADHVAWTCQRRSVASRHHSDTKGEQWRKMDSETSISS